jgi:hypothetical protein
MNPNNNRPAPRQEPGHLQLPVQAAQIYLDLAASVIAKNDGITAEDKQWYILYLETLLQEAKQ